MSEEFNFDPFEEDKKQEEIPNSNSNINAFDTFISEIKQEQKQLNEMLNSQPHNTEEDDEDEDEEIKKEIKQEEKRESKEKFENEEDENTQNIVIINRYKSSIFSQYLKENNIKFVIKDAKHNSELIHRIRTLVQNKNGNISDVLAYVTIDIVEKFVTNFLEYDISGLSVVCRDDVVMRDNLNEWMIECDITQLKSPKQRLLFNLLKNVYVVYTLNKIKKTMPNETPFIDQTNDEDVKIKKVIISKSSSDEIDNDELLIN